MLYLRCGHPRGHFHGFFLQTWGHLVELEPFNSLQHISYTHAWPIRPLTQRRDQLATQTLFSGLDEMTPLQLLQQIVIRRFISV